MGQLAEDSGFAVNAISMSPYLTTLGAPVESKQCLVSAMAGQVRGRHCVAFLLHP
jgi:hypothetical protein